VEHFVIFAHFEEVSYPSKSSNNLLSIAFCLSLSDVVLYFFQNLAFDNTFCLYWYSSLFAVVACFTGSPRPTTLAEAPCAEDFEHNKTTYFMYQKIG
jgi:hypothetical protein